MGEQINCMSANTRENQALQSAVLVIRSPRKSRISFGRTGMINPIARISRVTVTRIKVMAALPAFTTGLLPAEKNRSKGWPQIDPDFHTSKTRVAIAAIIGVRGGRAPFLL